MNELISNSRNSHPSADNNRPASAIVSRTLPPNLRHLLAHPETPTPAPRVRARPRFDENGRRLPSGPPPPRSWLATPRPAPKSMKTYRNERAYPQDIDHLPGLSELDVGQMGLRDMCLRQMANNWNFIKVYEINNLADIPTALRIRLMSHIAVYGPEEGIGSDGLKSLLMAPAENEQDNYHEYHNSGDNNYEFSRLDLSGSIGRSVSFKLLSELVQRLEEPEEVAETFESWDKTIPKTLNAAIPHLTHLSLSHPPGNISWPRFLSFSKLVPTLTHLSLAYWPAPNLTPNAITTVMSSPNGRNVQYGGTTFYSHSLDNDFSEAASILKRLAAALYGLEYLNLDGCCDWAPALRQFSPNSALGIDWKAQWPLMRTISMHSGWELDTTSSIQDIASVREAYVQAMATQIYLARQRQGRPWIEVRKEDLEAKYYHLWRGDEERDKRRAITVNPSDSRFSLALRTAMADEQDDNGAELADALERSIWEQ